jgi:hypothetical protein
MIDPRYPAAASCVAQTLSSARSGLAAQNGGTGLTLQQLIEIIDLISLRQPKRGHRDVTADIASKIC